MSPPNGAGGPLLTNEELLDLGLDARAAQMDAKFEQAKAFRGFSEAVEQLAQSQQEAQLAAQVPQVRLQARARDAAIEQELAAREAQAEGQGPPTPPPSPRIDPNKLGIAGDTSTAQQIFETVMGGAGVQQAGRGGNIGGYGEPGELVQIQEQWGAPNLADVIRGKGQSLYGREVTRTPDILTAKDQATLRVAAINSALTNANRNADRQARYDIAGITAANAERKYLTQELAKSWAGTAQLAATDPAAAAQLEQIGQQISAYDKLYPGMATDVFLIGRGLAQGKLAENLAKDKRKGMGGAGGGRGTEYERGTAELDRLIEEGDFAGAEMQALRLNSLTEGTQMIKVTRGEDGSLSKSLVNRPPDMTATRIRLTERYNDKVNVAETFKSILSSFERSDLEGGLLGAIKSDFARWGNLASEASKAPFIDDMVRDLSYQEFKDDPDSQRVRSLVEDARGGSLKDPKAIVELLENTLAYLLVRARKDERPNLEDLKLARQDTQLQAYSLPGAGLGDRITFLRGLMDTAVAPHRRILENYETFGIPTLPPPDYTVFDKAFKAPGSQPAGPTAAPTTVPGGKVPTIVFENGKAVVR